ncbi:MAG TPA: acyl-CoA dehydrogenase family protein [Marmoricola sp.]|nr:acyl-CoA dehydrogenase family protein [Marmoricola sp.]
MRDETGEHAAFRETVRRFLRERVLPRLDEWEEAGRIDRSLFREAGGVGLLGFPVPEEYGGPGVADFRYHAILVEETFRAGASALGVALAVHNDVTLPYLTGLGTPEQQARWLPGVVSGDTLLAIAMTEPGAGSDLAGIRTSAVRDGDHYVVNGAKTFISNGQNADLFVVAVRTSPERHGGLSLLAVEADTPGFARGRNLAKIGLHAQDTSELSFSDARVPVANLLGEEGAGFACLVRNLPQERLSLALGAVGAAEGVLAETVGYVRQREAFGRPLAALQATRLAVAELATEVDAARTFVDDCVREHLAGALTAARAAAVKWWTTELQVKVADRCLQLHGGYGYMREYPVSRAFVEARVQTIYGGATEVLKDLVGKAVLGEGG